MAGGGGAAAGRGGNQPAADPFGFGCGGGGGGGFGGFGGGGGGNPGPMVLGGTYNVALVVDGKTVETKPLRVVGDPEVVLTEAQRKTLFDMAMEMHELQKRASEAAAGVASLNRQITQLSTDMAAKTDIPADVKSSFDVAQDGRRGAGAEAARGGGRRRPRRWRRRRRTRRPRPSVTGKIAQAKNGMMGGMWPTSITMKAFTDAKAEAPKALSDANALFAKAAAVSTSLAKYNLKLEAPKPVDTGAAAKKKTNNPAEPIDREFCAFTSMKALFLAALLAQTPGCHPSLRRQGRSCAATFRRSWAGRTSQMTRNPADSYNDWLNDIFYGGAGAGWYWNDHLKTQVDFGAGTRADISLRAFTAQRVQTFESSRVTSSRPMSLSDSSTNSSGTSGSSARGRAASTCARTSTQTEYQPVFVFDNVDPDDLARLAGTDGGRTTRDRSTVSRDRVQGVHVAPRLLHHDARLLFKSASDEILFRFGFGSRFLESAETNHCAGAVFRNAHGRPAARRRPVATARRRHPRVIRQDNDGRLRAAASRR